MAESSPAGVYTQNPGVFDYTNIGTVAGTTTVRSYPAFLHSVTVTKRNASGVLTLYDSVGTSASVIGTITLGTQTFSDPPSTYFFDIRTRTALTVVNTADLGALVSSQ